MICVCREVVGFFSLTIHSGCMIYFSGGFVERLHDFFSGVVA